MRLRTTCKCGAEFDARAITGSVAPAWNVWLGFHSSCMGVEKWRENKDGTVTLTRLPAAGERAGGVKPEADKQEVSQ